MQSKGGKGIDPSQILRNFDQADSLLQMLYDRKSPAVGSGSDQCPVQGESSSSGMARNVLMRPKTDAVVIEELQTVNADLREHVDKVRQGRKRKLVIAICL